MPRIRSLLTCTVLSSLSSLIYASPLPSSLKLEKRIPAVVYGPGAFEFSAQGTPLVVLDNGVYIYYQDSDGNFVVYANGIPKWFSSVNVPGCGAPNSCNLAFQPDGNLVSYFNGAPTWSSNTGANIGYWLAFYDVEPYIVIYNSQNQPVWNTPTPTPPPAVAMESGHGGGSPCEGECNNGPDGTPGGFVYDYEIDF